MLNIQFKRNSQPIDDEDLQAVALAVRANMTRSICSQHTDRDTEYYLLLAKMVFRIKEQEQELATLRKSAALVQQPKFADFCNGDAAIFPGSMRLESEWNRPPEAATTQPSGEVIAP